MKITPKTKISKAMQESPKVAELLFEAGMMCCGCPMAQDETLEEGCKAHGMNDKEIKLLVEAINKEEGKDKKFLLEIEDIIYGLENYKELRPQKKRINTLRKILEQYPNKKIQEMINIMEEGHGILSKPDRINVLKKIVEAINKK